MRFKKTFQTFFLTMLIFLGGFSFVQAQNNNNYTLLAPLPGTTVENGGNCDSSTTGTGGCTATLKTYLPGIFNLAIGVGAVAAFVVITIFGFEYMLTDSLLKKQNAKQWVENALWGLGLVIFAYAILNTLNPALVNGNLSIISPPVVTGGGLGTVTNPCDGSNAGGCGSEQAAEKKLLANGNIQINGNSQYQCTSGSGGCPTQVAGLLPNTLTGINQLQQECGCTLNITGGSESHGGTTDPHAAGTSVDIAESSSLDDELNTLNPNSCQKVNVTDSSGNVIGTGLYEVKNGDGCGGPTPTSTHWHITFK